jgi:excisionase family DNA binding protein
MTDAPPFLRPAEVARLLGVSPERVYQLVRGRQIPAIRVGGAVRVPRAAWQAWLDAAAADALRGALAPTVGDSP